MQQPGGIGTKTPVEQLYQSSELSTLPSPAVGLVSSSPKKLLFTGQHKGNVGEHVRMMMQTQSSLLAGIYRSLGHSVERRAVVPGEDLSGYDAIFVSVVNTLSFGGIHQYGGLWALSYHPQKAVFLTLDDWDVVTPLRPLLRSDEPTVFRYRYYPALQRSYVKEAEAHEAELLAVGNRLTEGGLPPVMCAAFSWGKDFERVFGNYRQYVRELYLYDPSPFQYVDVQPSLDWARQKRWVFAATRPNYEWYEDMRFLCGWPVFLYAGPKMGQPAVHEYKIHQMYAESWGVMASRYPHSGAGCWRARYHQCFECGAIMLADPTEFNVQKFGQHPLCPKPDDVELLGADKSGKSLRKYQQMQAAWYYGQMPRPTAVAAQLEAYLQLEVSKKCESSSQAPAPSQ